MTKTAEAGGCGGDEPGLKVKVERESNLADAADNDGSSAIAAHNELDVSSHDELDDSSSSIQTALVENRLKAEIQEMHSQREALSAICQSLERQLNTAKEQLGNRCVALEVGAEKRETQLKRSHVRHVVLAAIVAALLGLPLGFAIGTVTGWVSAVDRPWCGGGAGGGEKEGCGTIRAV